MSIQAAALYALVGVTGAGQSVRDLNSVNSAVNKTQGTIAKLGKNGAQIGKGMVQVGQGLLKIGEFAAVAAVGAVTASAKIGTSFQAMTELIHTQAGASQAEVDKMRVSIQDMVHSVGTSPEALASGLYHIESVGVRGSAALDILKASALGAKVGLADMESVTNALTAVWFSGIKGAKSMTDAMAILDGIVGVGNMHLQDLTDSFKSGILGTSATFGVDIRSLGAAIATLTDAGVPANIAATRLNMTLSHMAAPVPKAIDTLKKLGISQYELANDLRKPDGIFVALQDLHDHLAKTQLTGGLSGDALKKAQQDLAVATLHLQELTAKHGTAASVLLAARNKVADLRAALAAGGTSAPGIVNGQLTPQGADALTKIFGGSRFGATAMQLLTQMDRVQSKYGLITQRSQTFGDNVKATMETAGFVWGQFRADIENSALAFSEGFLPALARAGSKLDGFLVGHRTDIMKLGKDLGGWLDKIDWKGVESGANSFIGLMKSVLDVISKIPPQIDLAIVGLVGVNKLSGGLLGKGAGNILKGLGIFGTAGAVGGGLLGSQLGVAGTVGGVVGGGLLGMIASQVAGGLLRSAGRGLLSRLPVVGGAAASLTAVHVWVDGMNPGVGFGLPGGGVPNAIGATGEGLLARYGLTAGVLGGVTVGVIAAIGLGTLLDNVLNSRGQTFDQANTGQAKTPGSSGAVMFTGAVTYDPSLPAGKVVVHAGKGGSLTIVGTGATGAPTGLTVDPNAAAFDTRSEGAGIRDSVRARTEAGFLNLGQVANDAVTALRKMTESSRDARHEFMDAGKFNAAKALSYMLAGIEKRSMAKYHWKSGHAPESWAMGTFGRDLMRYEGSILRSHQSAAAKLVGIEHLERLAVANKDWGVAHKLKLAMNDLQETVRKQKLHAYLTANLKLVVDGNTLAQAQMNATQFTREHNR